MPRETSVWLLRLRIRAVVLDPPCPLPVFFDLNGTTVEVNVTARLVRMGKLRAKWTVGFVTANEILTHSHHCTLARGTYTWKVYATDLAGNAPHVIGKKTLVVK